MMNKVTIHQPCYLPYLGVFYKIWKADTFVYLDDAQYSNGYVFDWNRIKTPQGECRLKIPTARIFGQKLTEVTPKDFLGWKAKHLKMVEMNYKKAPYFLEVFSVYRDMLMEEYGSLAELNIALMNMFLDLFHLSNDRKIIRASDMKIKSKSETRVIEICKCLGADEYISGIGGKHYQSKEHFAEAGIKLTYADYIPIAYKQQWGKFSPNMSVLDYVMNEAFYIDEYFRKCKEKEETKDNLQKLNWKEGLDG